MKRGKAGKGLNPVNDTALSVTRGVRYSHPNVTRLNDAYRKAKEEDPMLEYRMTFAQWKKRYLKTMGGVGSDRVS